MYCIGNPVNSNSIACGVICDWCIQVALPPPPPPPPPPEEQDDNYDLHPEEVATADENYDLHPNDDEFMQDTYEIPPPEQVSENNSIQQLLLVKPVCVISGYLIGFKIPLYNLPN